MTDYPPPTTPAMPPPVAEPAPKPKGVFKSVTYNHLKKLVTLYLPAFATFYLTLGNIWGLPNPEGVVASTVALATFLGVLLNVSSTRYDKSDWKYDGAVNVAVNDEGKKTITLEVNGDPNDIEFMKNLSLKVNT